MKYLLLICGDESRLNNQPEPAGSQRLAAWGTYTNELVATNKMRGGERLRPSATATTLRLNGGHQLLSDGPYAETKEQIGGFWVIKAADLDAALDWAAKGSAACGWPVEVRPFQEEPE